MTTAGIKKGDERNFVRSLDDVSAGRVIKSRMLRAENVDLGEVDVEVAQGIVLLSGNVRDPQFRIEAERIAWSAANVVEIGNEIQIKEGQGFVRNTKDGILNKSVKTRLIADKHIKGRNFNVETHDGVVYLLGVARTKDELERAAQIASTTRGAREVISYVRLADGAMPPSSLPSSGSLSAPASSYPQYQAPSISAPTAQAPSIVAPQYRGLPQSLSSAPSGLPPVSAPSLPATPEPIYRDPKTGEIIELTPGTKTIPYIPQAATPAPSLSLTPEGFPSDDDLGRYRVGTPGEAVSTIESAPYYVDPETGKEIPVSYIRQLGK